MIRESPSYQPATAPRLSGAHRRLVQVPTDHHSPYFASDRPQFASTEVKWDTTGGGISPPRHRRLGNVPRFNRVASPGAYAEPPVEWPAERLHSRDMQILYPRQTPAPYQINGISRDIPGRILRQHRPESVSQGDLTPPSIHSRDIRYEQSAHGIHISRMEGSHGTYDGSSEASRPRDSDPLGVLAQRRNVLQRPRTAEAPRFMHLPRRERQLASPTIDPYHLYTSQRESRHSAPHPSGETRPTSFIFRDDMTSRPRPSRPSSPSLPPPRMSPSSAEDRETRRHPPPILHRSLAHLSDDELYSGRHIGPYVQGRRAKKWAHVFGLSGDDDDDDDWSSDTANRIRLQFSRRKRASKIKKAELLNPTELLVEISKLQNRYIRLSRPNYHPRSNSWGHRGFDVSRDRILPEIYKQTQNMSSSQFWKYPPYGPYPMPGYHPGWYAYPPPTAPGPMPYPYLPPPQMMWPANGDHPAATVPSWIAAGWPSPSNNGRPAMPGMYPGTNTDPIVFVGPNRQSAASSPSSPLRRTTAEWDRGNSPAATTAGRRLESSPEPSSKISSHVPSIPMSIQTNRLTKAGSNSVDIKKTLENIKEFNKHNLMLARNQHVAQMFAPQSFGTDAQTKSNKLDDGSSTVQDIESLKQKLINLNPGVVASPEQLLEALQSHLNSRPITLGHPKGPETSSCLPLPPRANPLHAGSTNLPPPNIPAAVEIDPGFKDVIHEHTHSLRIDIAGDDDKPASREVQVILIYRQPQIYVLSQFLTEWECSHIISLCEGRWETSQTSKGGISASQETYIGGPSLNRTSSSARLPRGLTPLLERIERRVAIASNAPPENVEALVVCRYEPGQEFKEHHDGAFRISTVLIYLNDVDDGGETDFLCLGFQIRPQAGTAVQWNNVLPNGQADMRLTHAGLPPVSGPKFVVNCFINTEPQCPLESGSSHQPNRQRSTYILTPKTKPTHNN